jgi:V-type H+-transporting ATPase subunit A
VIKDESGSIFIPKGIRTNSLDREKKWPFEPAPNIKVSH